jgi:hypothetical protein
MRYFTLGSFTGPDDGTPEHRRALEAVVAGLNATAPIGYAIEVRESPLASMRALGWYVVEMRGPDGALEAVAGPSIDADGVRARWVAFQRPLFYMMDVDVPGGDAGESVRLGVLTAEPGTCAACRARVAAHDRTQLYTCASRYAPTLDSEAPAPSSGPRSSSPQPPAAA